jgi:hypothetical protein
LGEVVFPHLGEIQLTSSGEFKFISSGEQQSPLRGICRIPIRSYDLCCQQGRPEAHSAGSHESTEGTRMARTAFKAEIGKNPGTVATVKTHVLVTSECDVAD